MSNENKINQLSGKNLFETDAFKKRKEYIRKAYMSALSYGEEVELVGNSKNEGLLESLIGSKGVIIGRAVHKKQSSNGVVEYAVRFGDLKITVNSNDLRLTEEEPY